MLVKSRLKTGQKILAILAGLVAVTAVSYTGFVLFKLFSPHEHYSREGWASLNRKGIIEDFKSNPAQLVGLSKIKILNMLGTTEFFYDTPKPTEYHGKPSETELQESNLQARRLVYSDFNPDYRVGVIFDRYGAEGRVVAVREGFLTQCDIPQDSPSSPRPDINTQLDESTIIHPVLKVKARHGLESRVLKPNDFKALAGFRMPTSGPLDYYSFMWEEFFGKAEHEAVAQFCKTAPGLTSSKLEEIAGPPAFRGGRVPCWQSNRTFEDTWIYIFGSRMICVAVTFRDGHCIKCEVCDRQQEWSYGEWRASEICEFVKGKTIAEIEQETGKTDMRLIKRATGRDLWCYQSTMSNGVTFETRNGRCFTAKEGLILH